ncbi:MAG: hypothetical protein K8S18_07480, partial [Desulfobacula sp.]|nr:hypothetical protein [Desulfobacula sp.]
SKLLSFYHKNSSPNSFKDTFPKILIKDLREIPVPLLPVDNAEIANIVIAVIYCLSNQKDLKRHRNNFIEMINEKYKLNKISNRLSNWDGLRFGDFLKELKKYKIKLSLSEEAEWMQYFNEQKQKAQELKSEIERVDAEIDKMVYKLYGLTEEEIKIVEGK